ncbi:hypothetical protein NG701_01650 [Pseudarthrobacter sp. HLT3-5]|uniref:MarR family winged helix-turn-helix transcriptional regulator n=1 Tax=Pseudarthrobacter cellobiosi TaxID=2953654 RepID=UPI00208E7AB5|nr:hypothetical protein [Pseudarthrobacter sp. HLT3-5]MCO4273146.1 hypothetical protein [Pseudarthrobacter sp. HLT3-5]
MIRRQDPDDGRAQLVALSPAGADKLRKIEERRTATLQEYLSDWSQEDAEDTARILTKLSESLKHSTRAHAVPALPTAITAAATQNLQEH